MIRDVWGPTLGLVECLDGVCVDRDLGVDPASV